MTMTLKDIKKIKLPKDTRIEIQGLPAYEVEVKIDQDGKWTLCFKSATQHNN